MEDVHSVSAIAKTCILGRNICRSNFLNLLTITCLIQRSGISLDQIFETNFWAFDLSHLKKITCFDQNEWPSMESNKKLDFLESFHYENVSVGKILGRLYLDLLLQLPNIQLEFWLRNTGSKIRCSMSFSIEMNGKTVEPLNFPVFSIPTQKKRIYQILLTEKNYPLKHWWKP